MSHNHSQDCVAHENAYRSTRYGIAVQLLWYLFILLQLAHAGILLARRTPNAYLRKRSLAILACSTAQTGIILGLTSLYQLFAGPECKLKCYILPFLCFYFPISVLSTMAFRLQRIQRKIRLATRLTGSKRELKQFENEIREAKEVLNGFQRRFLSRRIQDVVQLLVFQVLVIVVAALIVALVPASVTVSSSKCVPGVFCAVSDELLYVFVTFWVTCQAFITYKLYKLRSTADPFKVQREIKEQSVLATSIVVFATIFRLTSPRTITYAQYEYHFNETVAIVLDSDDAKFQWILSTTALLLTAFSLFYPSKIQVIKLLRKRIKVARVAAAANEDAQVSLISVLQSPVGQQLFSVHMTNEYCPEIAQFYRDFTTWKNTFLATDPEVRQAEALRIFHTYIEDGTDLQLNLAERQRNFVITEFHEAQELGLSVAQDTFDEVYEEVWSLLLDAFGRFKDTPLFDAYQKERKRKSFARRGTVVADSPEPDVFDRFHDKKIPVETSFHAAYQSSSIAG